MRWKSGDEGRDNTEVKREGERERQKKSKPNKWGSLIVTGL